MSTAMSSDCGPKGTTQGPPPQQYHTFATSPPKSRGRPLSRQSASTIGTESHSNDDDDDDDDDSEDDVSQTPLPRKQMAVLAMIALCEQTALNSISPYLPDMTASFPDADPQQVGIYVGTIASSFALAQFLTNFFWGWVSDRIGRKPVILLGTILTAACFMGFGFCRTLWQAIVVQAIMGTVNGNQGVVSTCLGEITDRSNQSGAFTYLPVIYGIGGITGPILGGTLVSTAPPDEEPYPYIGPNLASAAILVVDFILTSIFLEESLQEATNFPKIGQRVRHLFAWIWQFTSSTRPSYLRAHRAQTSQRSQGRGSQNSSATMPLIPATHQYHLNRDEVLNRDMILLLLSYLIFALSNISFNSLYPIFAQADPPTGRHLTPQEIGYTLAFAGLVTIAFQICIFGRLRDKMGNRWSYRAGLFGFAISFALMPFVGYKDESAGGELSKSTILLAIELCVVLLIKTVSAVGGLTSALLLITNSAPDHSVLGALNGLAQTLSAAGRAAGPFLSGGLFSLAANVRPKGEAVAFGIFGGVSLVGFLLSFGIRSRKLEAAGWHEPADSDHDSNKSDDEDDGHIV